MSDLLVFPWIQFTGFVEVRGVKLDNVDVLFLALFLQHDLPA